jgi:DNA polymerase-3 subunit epsilon
MPRPVEIAAGPFAIVDVETTGFSPAHGHRVIEVAIVRMAPGKGILGEYATLVNPRRDVGSTELHGIKASDVRDAPTFPEIAGDIAAHLQDAVVVAHNARFDIGFLMAEFLRVGVDMADQPTICTLGLSQKVFPGAATRKLGQCCALVGVPYQNAHSALYDARAAAMLFGAYFIVMHSRGLVGPDAFDCTPAFIPAPWCRIPPSGYSLARFGAGRPVIPDAEVPYLARLVEKLPGAASVDPAENAYLDLLDRVLADRAVTADESEALLSTAIEWGLTRAQVFEAHHRYLNDLVDIAFADGVVTPDERKDLELVSGLLGLHVTVADQVIREAALRRKS